MAKSASSAACNNILIWLLVVGLFSMAVTNIVIVAVSKGDKKVAYLGFAHEAARGTIKADRVNSEIRLHMVLTDGGLGAISKIAIFGPTGDPPLVADPGPELIVLCGSPARDCSQEGLVIETTSEEIAGSGSIRAAIYAISVRPHRFWLQVNTYNTTAAILLPLTT